MSHTSLRLHLSVLTVVLWGAQVSHAGILVSANSRVGRVPNAVGTGLRGFYYADPTGFDTLRSLVDADAFIAQNQPTATFLSTEILYPRPGGNSDTTGDLLGDDASTLDPGSVSSTKSASVWRFRGAIAISRRLDVDPTTREIDVDFALGSDDSSRLTIGGTDILRVPGDELADERGVYEANDFRATASFEQPGLYPVDIVWWDYFGGIFIRWYGSILGGTEDGVPDGLAGIVPTSVLFPSVPRPGESELSPILPTSNLGGSFQFEGESGQWFDPPATDGFAFNTTDGSFFTEILGLPTGFAAPFTVRVGSTELGKFAPGDTVDFSAFPGGGVSQFFVEGISPAVDAEDSLAFPIQLGFNRSFAAFNMTPLSSVPEPSTYMLALLGGLVVAACSRRKSKVSPGTVGSAQ